MRNETYEQVLVKQGVGFDYQEKVALLDIDLQKGLRNQARLEEPVDQDLVAQYAAARKDGFEFPPVVLWRPGRGRWIPVDGNQRLAAYDSIGKKYTDAYLLKTTDEMIADRLTWTFNNLVNGKRLSREEALQHAVTFVRKYKLPQEQAAKDWGLKKWAVIRAVRAADLRETLGRNKVKQTPTLTEEKLLDLGALLPAGEDVFCEAARVVASSGVGTEDVRELVSRVKHAKTQEAKVKEVHAFAGSEKVASRRAETKGGQVKPKSPLPRDRLDSLVRQALRVLDDYDKAALRPPSGPLYREARGRAQDLANKLIDLFGLGALLRGEESA